MSRQSLVLQTGLPPSLIFLIQNPALAKARAILLFFPR
jgi:hypothetical protein